MIQDQEGSAVFYEFNSPAQHNSKKLTLSSKMFCVVI